MDTGRLGALIGVDVRSVRPLGGASVGQVVEVVLADRRTVFAKASRGPAPSGFFAAEAAGLRWLGEAVDGPPVPRVVAADDGTLVLDWIPEGAPTEGAADGFGRALDALHAAGADGYGAGWPGYVGSAPMDNTAEQSWPEFYARRRIEPYVRMLAEEGVLTDTAVFSRLADRLDTLAGPDEPPARLHGDLWSGNVLWGADGRAWLVDPAAHGGHRETDLAMLHLFGAPQLDRILASYADAAADNERPLANGWQDRVPLHQLFPLLVHAVLYGGGYVAQAVAVARRYAG